MRASLLGAGAVVALALGVGCSGERDTAAPASPAQAAPVATNGALVFARPAGAGPARRYELVQTDNRGTAATRFARRLFPDDYVAVSPDGTTVAFTRPARTGKGAWELGSPHDVFLAPASGGEPRRLDRTRIDERAPRFSDDSRWIVFSHSIGRETSSVGISELGNPGPWDVISRNGDESGGSWGPGSHRVLYTHGSFLNGEYDLYVTDADTGEVTRIPNTSEYRGGSWTPTGEIVVTTIDEANRPAETSVWLLAGDGSERRLVATTPGRLEHGLAFAPDGGAMALGLDFKDAGARVVSFPLGDAPVDLAAAMGVPGWSPLWSPDGSTIAFLRGSGVWLMDSDGGDLRRVAGSQGAERIVAWLPEPAG